VYLPQYIVGHWWETFLHNHRARRISRQLMLLHGVTIALVPWLLDSSELIYGRRSRPLPGQDRRGEPIRAIPRRPLAPAAPTAASRGKRNAASASAATASGGTGTRGEADRKAGASTGSGQSGKGGRGKGQSGKGQSGKGQSKSTARASRR
jgi:hypothetical protein